MERAFPALQGFNARLVRLFCSFFAPQLSPISNADLTQNSEYMLWTDAKSRELIAEDYPWFLETYDGYEFNIQRADAIRYFVLHKFGGVYLDLDIGCIRPIDALLQYEVILPRTIPVGVSNDLMFAAKAHPFMEQVIHHLIAFDHNWLLNYPTVMFSTGPMFVSAQYGIYMSSHPRTAANPGGDVRILPKSLYGKNAKPGEAPHSFFEHYYGSSWHGDDAFLWRFLGVWGIRLMLVALVFLILAAGKMWWNKRKAHGGRRRLMFGRYEVMLPRFHHDHGEAQLDLGPFTLWTGSSSPPSAASSGPPSPSLDDDPRFPLLPVSFDVTPASPTLSNPESPTVAGALRQASTWLVNVPAMVWSIARPSEQPRRSRRGRRSARGIMFFLPAIFTPATSSSPIPVPRDVEAISLSHVHPRARSRSPRPSFSNEKSGEAYKDIRPAQLAVESTASSRRSSVILESASSTSTALHPPPPYPNNRHASGSVGESWQWGSGESK